MCPTGRKHGGAVDEITNVRAVLLTPTDGILVIRRIRPGVPPYRVLPGGSVEPEDADPLAALEREVFEETGGRARVIGPLPVTDLERPSQRFYLARIDSWYQPGCGEPDRRTGPEFDDPARGEYRLEELRSTFETLDAIPLHPEPVAALLRAAVRGGRWDADALLATSA